MTAVPRDVGTMDEHIDSLCEEVAFGRVDVAVDGFRMP